VNTTAVAGDDPRDTSATELSGLAAATAFCRFDDQEKAVAMAAGLRFQLNDTIHPLCEMAATALQEHLREQTDWTHNFGLNSDGNGAVIGKMFGVLVVRDKEGAVGYLSAFSGKLANGNHHNKFVDPVFDGLKEGGFLNEGMRRLTAINGEIAALMATNAADNQSAVIRLKELRKTHSIALQRRIFEEYNFRNKAGRFKNLVDIFTTQGYKQPPAGAGECAGPKLLQYAFYHQLEPLALAEFWWGLSPKSATWKHGEFYQPCKEKCAPILAHMLSDN
jgi:tRNA pseudouridine32 synthase/23S rRNA pseudouridine746 synthase